MKPRRVLLILLGLLLAGTVVLMLPVPQWRTGRLPVAPLALEPGDRFAEPARRVWIDTDAACGASPRTDPDDCIAILLLANADDPVLAGISTVFGNAPLAVTDRTTRALVQQLASPARAMPPVHRGSAAALADSAAPAHAALREALDAGPLTIVALGPLTNVAAALRERPRLQQRVERIVAVMGRRPGHLFHPAEGNGAGGAMLFGHGPVFSDLNLVSDPQAAAEIVRMRLPLVLLPYDAARHVLLTGADLARMRARGGAAAWVAERAAGWLAHWRDAVGHDGFYPFDAMAAAFALRPELLRCARLPVRVGGDMRFRWPFRDDPALLTGPEAASAPDDATMAVGAAVYCPAVADGLHRWLAARLGDASR